MTAVCILQKIGKWSKEMGEVKVKIKLTNAVDAGLAKRGSGDTALWGLFGH